MSNQSIKSQAAQLIGIGFDGSEVTPEAKSLIARGVKNVIFFSRNAQSPEQFATLTHEVKSLSTDPILTSIDQEGGRVMRLREPFTPVPSMRQVGKANNEQLAYEIGQVLAKEIRAVNIDIDLAPVLDVDTNPGNPVISSRSFSPDSETVTKLGTAVLKGIQSQKVAACAKHFPGHGDTSKDSHHELPILPHNMQRLESLELPPFIAAIKANVACIMTAHVIYKPIDQLPATLSQTLITKLLREKLNFNGYIMSDDMQMKAIADHYGFEEAVIQSINAGVDLLWICHSAELQNRAIETIIKAVETKKLSQQRLEQSAQRMQKVITNYHQPATLKPDLRAIGTQEHRAIAEKIQVLAGTDTATTEDPTERFIRAQSQRRD